jgi:hypothetical protein
MKLYVAKKQLYIQGQFVKPGEEFILADKIKINNEYATYQNQISKDKAKTTNLKIFDEINKE